MEGLTKVFGSLILATSAVIEGVDPSAYCTRKLGDVLLKGATHPVTVYEVCDADSVDLLAHKMRTKDAFDLGQLAYAHGDFTEAYRQFQAISHEKRDHAAAYFRDRSAIMASGVQSLEWDGVEHMESK
jgi:hypothetical protein